MRELLQLFQNDKLTEEHIIEAMLTDLGSGLYAYMVMLGSQDREAEASRMKDLRDRIFKIRNKFTDGSFLTGEEATLDPVTEMQKVLLELQILEDMLRIYRPNESIIFQTPVNDAIGLVWTLKEHAIKVSK
jgi:hypothetical protein